MKSFSLGLCIALVLAVHLHGHAQNSKFKVSDVSEADFATTVYPVDSSADGVILHYIGSASYEVDQHGGFNIIYKKHSRIRLLNRKVFDEATISIPLYSSGTYREKLAKIEASTFNIENGKVVETKLDKNAVFEEKYNKDVTIRKFTMPNLHEGCIVDISYTVASPFERNMKTWYFQQELPVLYSEFKSSIPSIYDFAIVRQGFHPYEQPETKSIETSFNLKNVATTSQSQTYNLKTTLREMKWVMTNIPKTVTENFSNTVKDRMDLIEFQLSTISYPNQPIEYVTNSWAKAADQLLKRSDFGTDLAGNSSFYREEVGKIIGKKEPTLENAKKIFYHVRNNFSCKDHEALYTNNNLKKVADLKSGNVAEINLYLTALLRAAGFVASPVILSTRDHGKANHLYPIMEKFNYVLSGLVLDSSFVLLDATYAKMGFGKLHKNSYNDFGVYIDTDPQLIPLYADLVETTLTSLMLKDNGNNQLEGELNVVMGNNESFELRDQLAKKPVEEFFKNTIMSLPAELNPKSPAVVALEDHENALQVSYPLKMNPVEEDIFYFSPMIYGGYRENPFKAGERIYPVEMESAFKKRFAMTMDVPKGYKVDELPKSVRVNFNEDEAMFEYLINNTNGKIYLNCNFTLNKATFDPADYADLRDFFAFVVNKETEQIVFKKL